MSKYAQFNPVDDYNIKIQQAKTFLGFSPTADVVEVRHGEWKKLYDKAPRYVCTACNHLYNNREYKFCPNCGAKMDGERSENATPKHL